MKAKWKLHIFRTRNLHGLSPAACHWTGSHILHHFFSFFARTLYFFTTWHWHCSSGGWRTASVINYHLLLSYPVSCPPTLLWGLVVGSGEVGHEWGTRLLRPRRSDHPCPCCTYRSSPTSGATQRAHPNTIGCGFYEALHQAGGRRLGAVRATLTLQSTRKFYGDKQGNRPRIPYFRIFKIRRCTFGGF